MRTRSSVHRLFVRSLRLILGGGFFFAPAMADAPAATAQLYFVSGHWLKVAVGVHTPRGRWRKTQDVHDLPQPGDVVTIFDLQGKAGEVHVLGPRRPDSTSPPDVWSASIEPWTPSGEPYGLALRGEWPAPLNPPQRISQEDPQALSLMRNFLEKRGLDVPHPFLTQVLRKDLETGVPVYFIAAHSDESAMQTDRRESVYAVAIMAIGSRVFPLAVQTSTKPAGRTRADHQEHHGVRDFYRFLTFMDLDGDRLQEMVLYTAKEDITQVDVFQFNGKSLRRVLSSDKFNFN